jgi:uncharacterized protein YjiS (DUF1127 family)
MRQLALPIRSTNAAFAPRRISAAAVATQLLSRAMLWLEVRRQRRQLQSLSDAMLRDIGLSRADAEREATRPFWDLPWDAR